MSFDILGTVAFTYIEYRLERKLPIQTIDDMKYIRKRFHWVIEKFKEQYFEGGNKIDTKKLFTEMFEIIMGGIGGLDLSKLYDFEKGLATSMILVAGTMGCKLKVDREFFIDSFLRIVDQRFVRQRNFITEEIGFLKNTLVNSGVNEGVVLKVIEAGVAIAETYPYYEYTVLEYLVKSVGGIVEECKKLNIHIDHKILFSEENIKFYKIQFPKTS